MFERFSRSAKSTVTLARTIAADDGAKTVEAEHVLLALTRQAGNPTTTALQSLGISEASVRSALKIEATDALQAVGIVGAVPQPPRERAPKSSPRWGQSAKLVLTRALQVALDRDKKTLDDQHLLLALAQAEAGVIPRVLRRLDISPGHIEDALR